MNGSYESFTWEPRQDGTTLSKSREVSWPIGWPYDVPIFCD